MYDATRTIFPALKNIIFLLELQPVAHHIINKKKKEKKLNSWKILYTVKYTPKEGAACQQHIFSIHK